MKLILASASPRRAEILRDAGLTFTVLSSAVDETPFAHELPQDHVKRLAEAKAELVDPRIVGNEFHARPIVIKAEWPGFMPRGFDGKFVREVPKPNVKKKSGRDWCDKTHPAPFSFHSSCSPSTIRFDSCTRCGFLPTAKPNSQGAMAITHFGTFPL